jgi:hypothetical protein
MVIKGGGMIIRTAWVCGVVMMAGACDADEPAGFDDGDEAVELRMAVDNGVYLNGVYLNGVYLNGVYLNGVYLNGDNGTDYVQLSELKYEGVAAQAAWLEGSQLFVRDATGVVRSGVDMKKLKVKYDVMENGSLKKKTVKITHAQLLAPESDVWVYDLDLKIGEGLWAPLCLDGNGQRTQAILLNDVWSPATGDRQAAGNAALTYACRGAALAKCIEWGYKPWSTAGGTSLEEFHQSCTRMVRADYCGDGISHTVNGTQIHVLDEKGVQGVDPNVTYVVEAEWGPDGAVCLNSANTRLANQSIECQIPACGSSSFSSGGILQSGRITSGL